MNSEDITPHADGEHEKRPIKSESLNRENEALHKRLTGLVEASLRISESIDLDTVLQEVLDSARQLTEARYGALAIFNDSGDADHVIVSGFTEDERCKLWQQPEGPELFRYLNDIQEPLRLVDLARHIKWINLSDEYPPTKTFLGTPMRHRGDRVGNIYLGEKKGGLEFTPKDEETLVMFASLAALAIVNAHRYRDERQAKTDLEALVNTSPVGVLVIDAKTKEVLLFNEETRRISGGMRGYGHDFDRILGLMTFRRMDGREIPRDELGTERVLRTGEPVHAEEMVIHLPDGRTVTTLVNATPIRSSDGEVVSIVATIQDMTPIEQLERVRAEFLGMVSHELRTPLTAIKGSTATLLGSSHLFDPAETRQFLRIIDEQTDHMRGLISDLLDLTRIEAGTLSVNIEPMGVADIVDQARTAFLRGGARNGVEVDIPPGMPRIGVDKQRMVQVLNNLFCNASKYSPEWSVIRVTASLDDVYVAVSVMDEGRGVPTEHLPRLFHKFARVDGEDVEHSVGGDGLGLAICRGVVEAHGGRIWAENGGPCLGTRLTFTIPTAEETAGFAAPGTVHSHVSLGQTAEGQVRILAVDDDPQTMRYVRNTLSEASYVPIVTGDTEDVGRLVMAEKPALILLDLVLPGTDGFEIMKRLADLTDAPVVFLSAHGGDANIVRALDMGAVDYIVKPFSPSELVARVKGNCSELMRSFGKSVQCEQHFIAGLALLT